MKKLSLLSLIILLFCISCKKENINPYIGTSWTAIDDVAELIYGKTCTTTIEFLTETSCQRINIRDVKGYGSGTFVKQGTYTIKSDSVFWNVDGSNYAGIIQGSVLSIAEGRRIYKKDK